MKKVMIIDDEFTIRELVEMTLDPDYQVIKAETGMEAVDYLNQHRNSPPDLIILDIMMPKMDGYEVCKTIKEDEEFKKIPVIMLTAKHGMDDLKEGIKADCDEFITKPFEPDHLKRRVDIYIGSEPKDTDRKLYQFGKSMHYIKGRKVN